MEIVSANLFYFTGKITHFTVEISGCLDVFGTSGCYGALTSMLFVKTQKYQVMVELDLHERWTMTSVK